MKSLIQILFVLALTVAVAAQDTKKTEIAKKDAVALPSQESNKSAQEQPKKEISFYEPAYKLAFVTYELEDGKRINQRDYTMVVMVQGQRGILKVGTRVPITTGTAGGDKQFTYLDVGLEIRCQLREWEPGKIQAALDINVSSFALPEQGQNHDGLNQPIIRNTSLTVQPVLTPGKPTMIASIDDVNSKKRMQMEVTATKAE